MMKENKSIVEPLNPLIKGATYLFEGFRRITLCEGLKLQDVSVAKALRPDCEAVRKDIRFRRQYKGFSADNKAIASDWKAVGDEIRTALLKNSRLD